jgi:pyruvate/2-oxoglutarate dehydrogenase complex dihydrolipoamide dehydrogenase (E3) component
MTTKTDAIVIGTGQSGPSLAVKMAEFGWKVAICERSKFGGTCVNNGCIPTKTLIASARAAYMARRASDFGVRIDAEIKVDMAQVKRRKDAIVAQSNEGVKKWLKAAKNCTVYEGHARFESSRTVRVGETLLESDRIFIDVGGRATVPPIPGVETVPFLTNASMMDVDFLPKHLVILGGSYVGLEFAQMYRRFGSEVSVIERGPRVISREDEDVSDEIRRILEKEGIQVLTNCEIQGVERKGDACAVSLADGRTLIGSHLLLALGRRPNTDDLGLDRAGVQTDKRGFIQVDDTLRTNVPGIWALGDCNGRGAFTHTSYNDFQIVAANLLQGENRKVTDRILTYGLFIDPPLGRAGMTEKEVRASGRKALIAKLPMARVGRARERSETDGFMKILVDAETKRILGAALLGINGDEVVHVVLDVMYAGAPYTLIERAMHIHPTVAELLPTLLEGLKPLL